MKALTVLQPWPYAYARLGKDTENRGWRPKGLRKGDLLALHGGQIPRGPAELARATGDLNYMKRLKLAPAGLTILETYLTGFFAVGRYAGIVGRGSPWAWGPVRWGLDELFILPEPVPCLGRQGLWEVPEHLLGLILDQIPARMLASPLPRRRSSEKASCRLISKS